MGQRTPKITHLQGKKGKRTEKADRNKKDYEEKKSSWAVPGEKRGGPHPVRGVWGSRLWGTSGLGRPTLNLKVAQ